MSTEPNKTEDISALNREFVAQISDSGNGLIKEASEAGSRMIRRRIRENGFMRAIIPPKPVTDADLDRSLTTEQPIIIEDMEPNQYGAKVISFGDTPDTTFYRGDKFQMNFEQIVSPKFTKDINELRSYRMDLRAVVTDNSLKDIQTTEDSQFIAGLATIVGTTGGVGLTGSQQNFNINGGFTRDNYRQVLTKLQNFNLNNGTILMNRNTATAFLGFSRDEIGGDLAEKLFQKGLGALDEAMIFGVRHLFTIKRNLIPDGTLYVFAEPDYLGRFYTLQDLTMYVEKKDDLLTFYAKETVSSAIPNVAACVQINFPGVNF